MHSTSTTVDAKFQIVVAGACSPHETLGHCKLLKQRIHPACNTKLLLGNCRGCSDLVSRL